MSQDWEIGCAVEHVSRELSQASFQGYSKSGKRIKVLHNVYGGYGVCMVHDYFEAKNIRKKGGGGE